MCRGDVRRGDMCRGDMCRGDMCRGDMWTWPPVPRSKMRLRFRVPTNAIEQRPSILASEQRPM
eukprot:1003058-Prymnesium_polylepis.3